MISKYKYLSSGKLKIKFGSLFLICLLIEEFWNKKPPTFLLAVKFKVKLIKKIIYRKEGTIYYDVIMV